MNTRARLIFRGLAILCGWLLVAGCSTLSNLSGVPDVTVCKHVTYERMGGVWKATLEECKA